jgi:hypothetical protein
MTDDLDFMAPNGAAIADLGYELAYVVLKGAGEAPRDHEGGVLKRACEASDRKRPQKRPPYLRAISLVGSQHEETSPWPAAPP